VTWYLVHDKDRRRKAHLMFASMARCGQALWLGGGNAYSSRRTPEGRKVCMKCLAKASKDG